MEWILIAVLAVVLVGGAAYLAAGRRRTAATALADARAEAQRWYERLGGQLSTLPSGAAEEVAVRQALSDASERYNAAGSQLAGATTPRQFELARETALEGLQYIRAARVALGLDPGPDLPPLAAARAAGELTKERTVDVDGHRYAAGPHPGAATPYFYPGGVLGGRRVPRGWYSEPWWRTALIGGAWGVGSILLFDALFDSAWGDPGYAASDLGDGYEVTGDEMADEFAGDPGYDGGGDLGGGDFGGDFGGGDF
ncbi:hypothetical protein [Virgisporangium ochraceum]|uniref:DUF1542 domain-containing protein n=1 Tax=Virgisporangium ochraceum TaxID=65505 RepID=A0A8J3ZXZ8_9ACTN|nr:hypothetical protein [Virgisporangium ochraceum]GIJ70268.1 hypothetical protein Voc01_051850 [Virgisporangium ochraceum]